MSTVTESSNRQERAIVYGVVAAVMVILIAIGLVAWQSSKSTNEAQGKADQLIAAIEATGGRAPDRDQIVGMFGTDAAAVCANPNGALPKATLLAGLANGAGGPGTRPVTATARAVKGEALVISIYCPDQLSEFQQFVSGLKTAG
ncbi:MAG: hypothetical protein ACJ72N_07870 [Labedaea sp.]